MLAGGRTSPKFAAEAGVEHRPLADINGLPMVCYVLRALRGALTISSTLLVAPSAFPNLPEADLQIKADGGLEENIRAGLERCPAAERVLLITADLPFVTPEAVDDYVLAAAATGADLCYAGVHRETCREQFPGMKRTYLHTPSGPLTGGNLALLRAAAFERLASLLREAYRSRKSPLFLAKLIGFSNVFKFLRRQLTPQDIEATVSRLTGVRCRIIITRHASLGTDVDRPADLRLARWMLRPH